MVVVASLRTKLTVGVHALLLEKVQTVRTSWEMEKKKKKSMTKGKKKMRNMMRIHLDAASPSATVRSWSRAVLRLRAKVRANVYSKAKLEWLESQRMDGIPLVLVHRKKRLSGSLRCRMLTKVKALFQLIIQHVKTKAMSALSGLPQANAKTTLCGCRRIVGYPVTSARFPRQLIQTFPKNV